MDNTNREASQPLQYAARLPPGVRTSRLAIISLVVAVLGCPCLLGAFSNWINWYVPGQFNQVGRYGFVHFWFTRGTMILATVLPIAAVLRIAFSARTRTGLSIALAALAIALLWWGLAYRMYLMWRDFSPG